jgi:hypothetical protein
MDSARRRTPQIPWALLAAITAVAVGLLARASLTGAEAPGGRRAWLPWGAAPGVTLYYPHTSGRYLVPVTTSIAGDLASPETFADALASEPPAGLGLHSALGATPLAREARAQTLAAWPEAEAAAVAGASAPAPSRLLYFVAGEQIVAVPSDAAGPREALEAYLVGPADAGLVGLPADMQLLGYEHDTRNGLLRVNLGYSPAVRALATEQPETMRRVLLGLIATLTAFPEVQAVMLDFEGRARLGVGQCAELLRTPQRRPELLNDGRLLARGQ